jgi:hypothetical protein
MRAGRSSPASVAAAVLLLYGAWIGWARHLGHDWREWADVGRQFAGRSESAPIRDDLRFARSTYGYDGQFFLYIAQDPTGAKSAIDNASYRYGRITYPVVARALALGRAGAVPATLVLLNLAAVVGGAWAAAAWLRRRGLSVWLALLYAAFPGVFFAVWRDLSETLAYSLVAAAVLVFDLRRRGAVAASAALFALAALTRETTLAFAAVWAATLLARRRPAAAALFAAGAALPYVGWRIFIRVWLGSAGIPDQTRPTLVPFAGIAHWFPWGGVEVSRVYAVFLPGVFAAGLAAYALYRGAREPAVWALLVNALALVVFLPASAYDDWKSAGRLSTGVVLAMVLSIPALDGVLRASRTWLWLPVVAWFAPWYDLVSRIFESGWD